MTKKKIIFSLLIAIICVSLTFVLSSCGAKKPAANSDANVAKAEALSSSEVTGTVTTDDADYTERIYKLKNGGVVAYVTTISPNYGTLETEVLVYIDANGTVAGVEKLFYKVSDANPEWGYNPPAEDIVNATLQSFVGKKVADIESVDIAIGVTSTMTRVREAITEALELSAKFVLPRADAEIVKKAETLSSSKVSETVVPVDTDYAARVFKLENGGIVVYTVAISPNYGSVETELLVYISTSGVVGSIEKVYYKVSDANPDWGYNPPAEDVVNATIQSFVGKKVEDITSVDIAIGVTSTMGRVRDSVVEALELSEAFVLPRAESEIMTKAETLSSSKITGTVVPDDEDYTKRIYKLKSGGCVAYVVTISPNYGTVETELLVYIDATGTIKAVEKVYYKVSDANPDWGYNPPSDDIVNATLQSFVDKKADTITSVDIAIGVTSTMTRVRDAIVEALDNRR